MLRRSREEKGTNGARSEGESNGDENGWAVESGDASRRVYISVPTTNRPAAVRGGIGMGKTDKDLGHPVGSRRHDEDK